MRQIESARCAVEGNVIEIFSTTVCGGELVRMRQVIADRSRREGTRDKNRRGDEDARQSSDCHKRKSPSQEFVLSYSRSVELLEDLKPRTLRQPERVPADCYAADCEL